MRRLLLALVLLLALPMAAAQPDLRAGHVLFCSKECRPSEVNDDDLNNTPVNVVLYAHIQDALQRAPLNVLPPDAGGRDVNQGFLTPTLKVGEDVLYLDNSWFYLYHMPTPVLPGAASANQDGPLSYPLELVGPSAKLYWYLSPHAVPNQNSTSSPAGGVGAMPQLTVYARIETGRHPFHGTLIAEGRTTANALVSLPGEDYAYQFEVPLDIKESLVPPEEGFVVSINWFQYENGERQVTQSDWRVRTGLRFVPRLILPVGNPMQLTETAAFYRAGTHIVGTTLSPVFGAYDIDPYSLRMTYEAGPTPLTNPTPVMYFYNPIRPQTVKIFWAVSPDDGPLKAGAYDFHLEAMNLQRTYRFQEDVPLEIVGFASAERSGLARDSSILQSQPLALGISLAGVVAFVLLVRPR